MELVQALGRKFERNNIVVYVDSSGGELKNRKPLKLENVSINNNGTIQQEQRVIEGPGDSRDKSDPLTLNVVFPDGYQQYIEIFQTAAKFRSK